jgi:hypothetical protein
MEPCSSVSRAAHAGPARADDGQTLWARADGRHPLLQARDGGGLGVPLLWPFLGRELNDFYERINVVLKSRCEAQHSISEERA